MLIFDVISRSVTYYVQRHPATLAEFRWRIDQKNSDKPTFEQAFERISPSLLQTMALSSPLLMVEGVDYSAMSQYEFPPGDAPTYLRDTYGISSGNDGGFNVRKILCGNLKFVDSKDVIGVQAADLIASGIRRCLRQNFSDNRRAATLLGGLMVQAVQNKPPLQLVSLSDSGALPQEAASLVRLMISAARPYLAPNF